ncbi:MAG TPA: MarR family transcriptional regulator [Flavobacteriales bacterium]|nr:MarR family transcriptional regulator [Flavobacteriales bacterium]
MDPRTVDRFRATSRQYSDSSILMHEAIARRAGLSGTDHKYLGFIVEHGRMTAGELAKATGLTTGAVTGLIDRLVDKKLVERLADANDRRKVLIVPVSANVKKLMHPLFKELGERTRELIGSFTEKEIKVIDRYFRSAIAIMDETRERLNKP